MGIDFFPSRDDDERCATEILSMSERVDPPFDESEYELRPGIGYFLKPQGVEYDSPFGFPRTPGKLIDSGFTWYGEKEGEQGE